MVPSGSRTAIGPSETLRAGEGGRGAHPPPSSRSILLLRHPPTGLHIRIMAAEDLLHTLTASVSSHLGVQGQRDIVWTPHSRHPSRFELASVCTAGRPSRTDQPLLIPVTVSPDLPLFRLTWTSLATGRPTSACSTGVRLRPPSTRLASSPCRPPASLSSSPDPDLDPSACRSAPPMHSTDKSAICFSKRNLLGELGSARH